MPVISDATACDEFCDLFVHLGLIYGGVSRNNVQLQLLNLNHLGATLNMIFSV
jgi:hypothetical protein